MKPWRASAKRIVNCWLTVEGTSTSPTGRHVRPASSVANTSAAHACFDRHPGTSAVSANPCEGDTKVADIGLTVAGRAGTECAVVGGTVGRVGTGFVGTGLVTPGLVAS